MSRTKGARDRVKRRPRSDRKHRYVKRNGKMVRYVPKRKRGDPIKLIWWQVCPMSPEGYARFSRDTRAYMRRTVFKYVMRVDAPPERLSTKEEIANFALETVGFAGTFLLKGFSHGKNKWGIKQVTLCHVKIVESQEGLRAVVSNTSRVRRYWFWRETG